MQQLIKSLIDKYLPFPHWYIENAYWDEARIIRNFRKINRPALDKIRLQRLQQTCQAAAQTSPFYHERFKKYKFDPFQLVKLSDLERLPILSKEEVRDNLDKIVSRAVPPKKLKYITTGGSTGLPLGIYLFGNSTYARTYAHEERQYSYGGLRWWQRKAIMRGKVTKALVEFSGNTMYLSSFQLSSRNINKYVEALQNFKPRSIEAYPSSIGQIAKWISSNPGKFNFPFLNSIFLSSETLTESQRLEIQKAFGCAVFNKYGNCEQATIIGQCSHGTHHEFEEYSYSEFIDNDGKTVNEGLANLISTTFVNQATPLIRYSTGDIVELPEGTKKCKCGIVHRTINKISGRTQDFLLGKSGERITVAAINSHSSAFDQILGFQYVQTEPGKATINVVPRDRLTQEIETKIIQEASHRSGYTIEFEARQVSSLQKTPRGKTLYIVRS